MPHVKMRIFDTRSTIPLVIALAFYAQILLSANAADDARVLWLGKYPVSLSDNSIYLNINRSVMKFEFDQQSFGYLENIEEYNGISVNHQMIKAFNLFKNHWKIDVSQKSITDIISEINETPIIERVSSQINNKNGCFIVEIRQKYKNNPKYINKNYILIHHGDILSNFNCTIFQYNSDKNIKSCRTFAFWPFKSGLNMAMSSAPGVSADIFVDKLLRTAALFAHLNEDAVGSIGFGSLFDQGFSSIPSPGECQLIELGN